MSTQITETFAEIGIPPNPFPGLRPLSLMKAIFSSDVTAKVNG